MEPHATAELWIRPSTPGRIAGDRSTVPERLRRLADSGRFDDVGTHVWGRRIGLSTTAAATDRGSEVLDRVAACREWADRTGHSVEPFFERRETVDRVTGETFVVQELPIMALVEFRGETVTNVSPSRADGTVVTVPDRLERLEAEIGTDAGAERPAGRP